MRSPGFRVIVVSHAAHSLCVQTTDLTCNRHSSWLLRLERASNTDHPKAWEAAIPPEGEVSVMLSGPQLRALTKMDASMKAG